MMRGVGFSRVIRWHLYCKWSAEMTKRFKTIVVTTDLNEEACPAVRYARLLARSFDSTLMTLHVADPLAYASLYPLLRTAAPAEQEDCKRIRIETDEQIPCFDPALEADRAAERILRVVHENHADLLVLGTRAHTAIGRVALGRVVRTMLARCSCPILAVSCDCDSTALPWSECWPRVLAATDFSPVSIEAVYYAHRVALRELIVLHVSSEPNGARGNQEKLRFIAPFNEQNTVPVEHLVVPGDPAEQIAEYAKEFGVSLIVLGSPRSSLSEQELEGSTILGVIAKARCPVLCLPLAYQPISWKAESEQVTA
jgi:nucleotide-binding universal stress UspA family protein